jgi:hypothetical protein
VRTLIASTLLVAIAAGSAVTSYADQGGVPFWTSGQFASLAAVSPGPGWSLTVSPYYYNGSASASRTFQIGTAVAAAIHSETPLALFQLGIAPEDKILSGQAYFGVGWGAGTNRTSADITLTTPRIDIRRSEAITAGTDLYPFASLSWTAGNHYRMVYMTGDAPTGAYEPSRLANLGIGHGAVDGGGGYTYLNSSNGLEFSAVLGVTYNTENSTVHYRNGVDSHLDYAASQWLSPQWELGVAGYVYHQLTDDSGSGDHLGPFRSRINGLGPEVGHSFTANGQESYWNLRSYWEWGVRNRVTGYAILATVTIPLGGGKSR